MLLYLWQTDGGEEQLLKEQSCSSTFLHMEALYARSNPELKSWLMVAAAWSLLRDVSSLSVLITSFPTSSCLQIQQNKTEQTRLD